MDIKKTDSIAEYVNEDVMIKIDEKRCKNCEICIEFCPKNVLDRSFFTAVVKNLESCSKCMLCELRCPDFAISVFPLKRGKEQGT